MLKTLRELFRYRELLTTFVRRELEVRYKGTIFGILWSLITPILSVTVMTFVVTKVMALDANSMSAYILAAYLPFTFTNQALLDSAQSVLMNMHIIRKVYMPRELFPISVVIANAIHFMVALCVLFLFMFATWARTGFAQSPFTWHIVFLPVILLVHFILMTGLALLISSLNVFYEDIKHVLGILLWILFFLTPVMYFDEQVYYSSLASGKMTLYNLYNLNPIAILCTMYRKTLVAAQTLPINMPGKGRVLVETLPFDWYHFTYLAVFSIVVFIIGYTVFEKLKWRFVERP